MKKKCSSCGKTKSTSQFGLYNSAKDKLRSYCKICKRIIDKNREHNISRRFSKYKAEAKKCNRAFNLDINGFEKITSNPCKYCGKYSNTQHNKQFCGIDRINSNKGYVKGNMAPCCDICNRMKMALTDDEFVDHISGIASHLKLHSTNKENK